MLLILQLVAGATDSGGYSGTRQQLRVPLPRIEARIAVDGNLDEPAWARAARLTDFSQFNPADGRPAEERTEVLFRGAGPRRRGHGPSPPHRS
jgi:hypothetical protein